MAYLSCTEEQKSINYKPVTPDLNIRECCTEVIKILRISIVENKTIELEKYKKGLSRFQLTAVCAAMNGHIECIKIVYELG